MSNKREHGNTTSTAPSIACTLTADQLRKRLDELRELTQNDLISAQREDLALQLRYRREAERSVRRMIEREQECCPFLVFDLRIGLDAITLGISAPEAARQGIEDIYAQFLNDDVSSPRANAESAQSNPENAKGWIERNL